MTRSRTRRRAAWWLLFCGVFFCGDRLLAALCQRAVLHSRQRFAMLYRGRVRADVLIVGNSRGISGFDAPGISERAGVPAFNLSYNGLSMPLTDALFQDCCDRNTPPKLLIVEASGLFSDDTASVGDLRLFSPMSRRLSLIEQETSPGSARAARWCHLWTYNDELYYRVLTYERRSDQDWLKQGMIAPDEIARAARSAPFRWTARPRAMEALKRLLARARAEHVSVRLVLCPYQPGFAARFLDLPGTLREIETEIGGDYRVMDYSSSDPDPFDFVDNYHLNPAGTQRFLGTIVRDRLFDRAPVAVRGPSY